MPGTEEIAMKEINVVPVLINLTFYLVQDYKCWKNPCASWDPALSQHILLRPSPVRGTLKLRWILIPRTDGELLATRHSQAKNDWMPSILSHMEECRIHLQSPGNSSL